MTPETRQVLARYEDITAQYTARVNEIGEEFAAELASHDAEVAEQKRLAAEQQPSIDAAHEAAKEEFARAQAAAAEEKPTAWTRESRPTVLSFNTDEDHPAPPPPAAPAPPSLPAVVVPEDRPAAWPRDQRPSVLSFEVDPFDDPAPPTPPRRPSPADDQDDDWSGRSWVR
ncbi:hypothetical protein [Actinokineospora terrae]|uniref:Uncharacterized protein n=1 Tax=Actinokineospora terrae TaxID=155974 RepID=A0A1H9S082_9PSEU|nr:hypothetical protein [Actinokineospora terrae]SER78442.1 hypothetical protein SAMN04487818_105208 [Actinokineospora terrae]